MAEQLASVPEESSTDFTALSPGSYSYRESLLSVAGPERRIGSTLSSQSGQSKSNYSSISGFSSGSASAGAANFGANELPRRRPSIYKVSSNLAKELSSVSEESTTGSTVPCPPSSSYRESIWSVAWPEWRIVSTFSSQSGQSGSNYSSYSGASSSYLSNISGYSSGLGSAGPMDSGGELTKIAHRMVSDGYTQRMVQAFGEGGGKDRALKNWFVELDVEWVLKSRPYTGEHLDLLLRNTSASWHRELIEKWVRALTIIVTSIKKELVAAVHPETWAVAEFCKASILPMLVFVEIILGVFKVENLQPMLHMYICVSSASYDISTTTNLLIDTKPQRILNEIGDSLKVEADTLIEAISTKMKKVGMTLNDDNDSWAIEILEGGGEVHKKIRLMVDYIVLMRKTHALTQNSAQSQNTGKLGSLIQDMINDLNYVLLQKSELCSDPNLRHLFLLNNSYFVAQEVSEPSIPLDVELSSSHQYPRLELIPQCEKYVDSYLDVSWGHVLYYIVELNSLGQPKPRKKASSLAKFQSAFHQMYQDQKFWKVPDPQLRSLLRETITKRVISGYRDYLKGHPELEKQVSGGSYSPEIMEEMLGELFEG